MNIWECRYIEPTEFELTIDMSIYNNVVSLIQLKDDEIFCVEIYSNELATMQKALFDQIWHKAIKMKKIDKRGIAEI